MSATKAKLPKGWDEARLARVLEHYETQPEDEAVREDEAAIKPSVMVMDVPSELVGQVRALIAKRQSTNPKR